MNEHFILVRTHKYLEGVIVLGGQSLEPLFDDLANPNARIDNLLDWKLPFCYRSIGPDVAVCKLVQAQQLTGNTSARTGTPN